MELEEILISKSMGCFWFESMVFIVDIERISISSLNSRLFGFKSWISMSGLIFYLSYEHRLENYHLASEAVRIYSCIFFYFLLVYF